MEQNQETKTSKKEEQKVRKELTPQEIQKRKKLIIFPIMILAFIASLWLIFAPSGKKEKSDGISSFNSELPLPDQDEILSDKKKAYEQEQIKKKQTERMRTLEDFGFDIEKENNIAEIERSSDYNHTQSTTSQSSAASPISTSANRYKEINQQLESFYNDTYAELDNNELFDRITELEMKVRESESSQTSVEEQLALLEKSYELAAKYINSNQSQTAINPAQNGTGLQQKVSALPVKAVAENIVSALNQPMSDSAFIAEQSKPRNRVFHTVSGTPQSSIKNTILACIHEDQIVMDGQNVRLRLLEPLQAGYVIIPRNSLITGTTRIQRERLDIDIVSIEYNGTILSVDLAVYDSDGQKGLASPTTLEMQSLTEGAANIGAGLGSTFTINQNAGSAIVSDLTRGVLQGGSQYLSKKLRTARVSLKADYKVMLLSK